MRNRMLGIVLLIFLAMPLMGQTADEIIGKYIKSIGGSDKIRAIQTLRYTGKIIGGGGFEAKMVIESKRPNLIRQEFSFQGMTGITAYNGKAGWKIQPWGGKKDPEALGEDEMKGIEEDADFDGPLVNYQEKGNTVEYQGMEPVEGTDAYKIKVTLKNGDVFWYYMDSDYFVPIKIESKRIVRGEEQEGETILGDYKEVSGLYLPFSMESGAKGSPDKGKTIFEKVEANVPLQDNIFEKPATTGSPVKSKQ